jgi:cysteinyl-tRNA synthetase
VSARASEASERELMFVPIFLIKKIMLRFYNTLTRKKEIFKPLKKEQVGIYSCGPTVYDFAHIGNFRSYLFADLLRRYLEYKGFKVKQIMNITDIDDKTIKRSKEEKMKLKDFTEKYTKEFFKDIKTLNIKKAFKYPRATDHIKEMIKMVEILEKKGFAYEKNHSVYFDISKFKDYGKLSKINLKKIKPGARVDLDEYEKKAPGDFTLLKRSTLDELKRGIFYQTKWGKVRPGWHLECSVMSMKYLGKSFDIHTGGVDLIFPHHENEIAQSEAFSGKKFVNFWLHNEHLIVEGKKMSKSLGNYYTLRDLLKKDYPPLAIRYLLLATHYRQKLNFTFEGLEAAKNSLERLKEFIRKLKSQKARGKITTKNSKIIKNLILKTKKDFEEALDDDLNISKALAAIFNLVKKTNKLIDKEKIASQQAKKVYQLMKKFDKVLGLNLRKEKKIVLPKEIKNLLEKREKYRQKKQWEAADKIRQKIEKMGYKIEDTKEGPKIKKNF